MTLGDFLKRELSNSGPWNCSTFPMDWCIALGHPDYAAAWRHVTDPADCDAATPGGLLPLWEAGLPLPVVSALAPGDIAVVSAAGGEAGAIWTGERWAMKAARGVHFITPAAVALLKAWRP